MLDRASASSGCGSEGYGFDPHRPPHLHVRPTGIGRHPKAPSGTPDAANDAAELVVPVQRVVPRTRSWLSFELRTETLFAIGFLLGLAYRFLLQ